MQMLSASGSCFSRPFDGKPWIRAVLVAVSVASVYQHGEPLGTVRVSDGPAQSHYNCEYYYDSRSEGGRAEPRQNQRDGNEASCYSQPDLTWEVHSQAFLLCGGTRALRITIALAS